jgi:predicted AlkP superfamily pyrophosphatase or phosphodiesterase
LTEGIEARVVNNGALAHLYLAKPEQKEEVVEMLRLRPGKFKIEDVESRESYKDISRYRDRFGDILILPELGYYLADERGIFRYQNNSALFKTDVFGEHGYGPEYREMHGIFYANGPSIKEGLKIDRFENIHIYPLICQILGLPIPVEIDGDVEVLAPILKD